VRTLTLREFHAEWREGMTAIFTVVDEMAPREGVFHPPFRAADWVHAGIPFDVWKAGSLVLDHVPELTEREVIARDAWPAWLGTLVEHDVKDFVLAVPPVWKNGLKEHDVMAAVVAPDWRDLSEGCRAIDAYIPEEWLAYGSGLNWGLYCHHEDFSILGASPDWLSAFCARFGDMRRLRRGFEDHIDFVLGGDDDPTTPMERYAASIKRSVKWPGT